MESYEKTLEATLDKEESFIAQLQDTWRNMDDWMRSVDPFVFPGASAKEDHKRDATVGAGAYAGAQIGARAGAAVGGPAGAAVGGMAGALAGGFASASGYSACTKGGDSKGDSGSNKDN